MTTDDALRAGWAMLPFRVWPLVKQFGTQMGFVLRKATPPRQPPTGLGPGQANER